MKGLFYLTAIWALSVTHVLAESSDKLTLGWIEPVIIDKKLAVNLEAKLDTGADYSSLDAHDIKLVRVGEKRYVRFSIEDPKSGELVEVRKPYLRRVRIKRHGGSTQRRYVVRMKICIGDHTRSIDVNLIDREYFDYPMLLGRNALMGWAVIDPAKKRTIKPTCWLDSDPVIDVAANPDDVSDSSGNNDPDQSDAALDAAANDPPGAAADAAVDSALPDASIDAVAETGQPGITVDIAVDTETPVAAMDTTVKSDQTGAAVDFAVDTDLPVVAIDTDLPNAAADTSDAPAPDENNDSDGDDVTEVETPESPTAQ